MDIPKNDVKYQIAEKLFEFFVVNDKYAAVQMPDGRYIPKRINCTPALLFDMLESNASLGMYQQQYGRKWMKWVCLDFDCKDFRFLDELVKAYVLPVARELQKKKIRYLAEFSGRRGVHLWILTKGIITKAQGYMIATRLTEHCRSLIKREENYGLDLFPAVAGGGMKLGKQVKLPLSVHRKGGRSFFIPDFTETYPAEWIHLPERPDFWKIQLNLLQTYESNDLDRLWDILQIHPENEQKEKGLLYKKEYLIEGKNFSLEEIKAACADSSVFSKLLCRAMEGCLRYLDRLVLVGCFGNFQSGELLLDIMKQQNNYKENVTRQYLSQLKNRYYPVTMQYLYDLYGEPLEQGIDPQATILEFMAERLGLSSRIKQIPDTNDVFYVKNRKSKISPQYFQMIRDKEIRYMLYDDEVLSVNDYLELTGMKQYDFQCVMDRFLRITAGSEILDGTVRSSLYERWEEGKAEPRVLVTLSPQDRILTTALIFELVAEMGSRFHSYSYNLNFWDQGSVFMPWYDSWKRFQQDIESYLRLDFFSEYGLIKLDLTRFYDSIYMHALFHQIEETDVSSADKNTRDKAKYILRYLGNYTEQLMYHIRGKVRGVPQGPAYARVLAEMFLTAVLDAFCRRYGYSSENCQIMRYVDDIFIVYRGVDGRHLMNQFAGYIQDRGLEINWNKTILFERIGDMSEHEKKSIFEDGEANYAIKSIQGMELEDEEYRQEKIVEFERYLKRKGNWSVRDANFILNRYLDPVFVKEYLDQYAEILVGQTVGRGSIYKRLYEEILDRDDWLERFFVSRMYCKIPQRTVNFKNFISVCYFRISRLYVLNDQDKKCFIKWLKGLGGMEQDDYGTIGAIVRLLE